MAADDNRNASASTIQYSTVRYGTVRYGTVRYGTVRYGTVQYNTIQSFIEAHSQTSIVHVHNILVMFL